MAWSPFLDPSARTLGPPCHGCSVGITYTSKALNELYVRSHSDQVGPGAARPHADLKTSHQVKWGRVAPGLKLDQVGLPQAPKRNQ